MRYVVSGWRGDMEAPVLSGFLGYAVYGAIVVA
jgi:hypothetical protein